MTKLPAKPQDWQVAQQEKLNQMINDLAKQEGIPPTGITVMGGRPYINVTGLDVKLKNLCKERNLELARIEAKRIVEPTDTNGYLVGYHAEVVLFDRENFTKSLTKLPQIDRETLQELRDAYTYRYTGEGWASPKTCEGIGYKYQWKGKAKVKTDMLLENIIMMAERRATNRAKREATGTGLTSVDELPLEGDITAPKPQPEKVEIHEDEETIPAEKKLRKFNSVVEAHVRQDSFKEWCKSHAIFSMKEVKDMLEAHYGKPPCEVSLDELQEWMAYIEQQDVAFGDEEVESGTGQRKDLQESIPGIEGGGATPQGELLNDSD